MYNRGGLGRSGRELGAVGASVVNRCIYCAAVHASRYNQLTKTEDHVHGDLRRGRGRRSRPGKRRSSPSR